MIALVWWSHQGTHHYNVWKYHFSVVSASLWADSVLSETISGHSQCCMHTSSMLAVSSDTFQILTDCWHTSKARQPPRPLLPPLTLTHNHVTTNSDPFLSHVYTNFYTCCPQRHTCRCPCQTVPTAVEIWNTFLRHSPCPQVEIHMKWPHLKCFQKRCNSFVLLINKGYD